MNLYQKSEERFRQDTSKHEMTVMLDEGLHRHLRFKQPGTNTYCFHLVTWPGFLSIGGDVATYMFSRLPDMFRFFRDPKGGINPDYWAGKIESTNRNGGHKDFCGEREGYSFRFLWCCHAIVWGINQYDAFKRIGGTEE